MAKLENKASFIVKRIKGVSSLSLQSITGAARMGLSRGG